MLCFSFSCEVYFRKVPSDRVVIAGCVTVVFPCVALFFCCSTGTPLLYHCSTIPWYSDCSAGVSCSPVSGFIKCPLILFNIVGKYKIFAFSYKQFKNDVLTSFSKLKSFFYLFDTKRVIKHDFQASISRTKSS